VLRDLLSQLASRRQDQRDAAVGFSLEQLLEQRNAEGCGFAAAGRRARKDVVPGQSNGNRRSLDRGGLGIVKIVNAAANGSI